MVAKYAPRVISLLVVNKPPKFAQLALDSLLTNSEDLICIGFLNNADISELPKNSQIRYVRIPHHSGFVESNYYLAFDKSDFFRLVTFKWALFQTLFDAGVEHIVYTDLDVIWFSDVSRQMDAIHKLHPDRKVFIQDATIDMGEPRLCMGLVSIKKCHEVLNLIKICYSQHLNRVMQGDLYGDDDVITDFYMSNRDVSFIEKLPQSIFPVGIFMNLLRVDSPYGGLISSKPSMFHANYVVGAENKLIVMKIAQSLFENKSPYAQLTYRERLNLRFLNFKIKFVKLNESGLLQSKTFK